MVSFPFDMSKLADFKCYGPDKEKDVENCKKVDDRIKCYDENAVKSKMVCDIKD